jgi:glycosyltransferase involved in cell wall biosynthesis
MKFVFWQNMLSIHQSAFLRNLAENNDVVLVAEEEIDELRKKQGWIVPDFGKVKIIVAPNQEQINNLLETKNSVHTFSGVNAFPLISSVFRLAVKKGLRIGIMTEPFDWYGIKGKLRFIKYFLFNLKYRRHIDFILAIGKRGRWCFEKTGFTKKIIFDWAYFTEVEKISISGNKNIVSQILFVGSIDENKNILFFVDVCKNLNIIDQLQIVGTGSLEQKLKQKIIGTKCRYWGQISNAEVKKIMSKVDLLILPSKYKDGWGAVVNEALLCGTSVIASDACGASILLNGIRGRRFSIKKNNLEEVLSSFLRELPCKKEQRIEIQKWANKSISGESAATYFIEIMESVYAHKDRPVAPWLKK